MQAIANATRGKIPVASLTRPAVEKRRSLSRDARPSTECISKKAAPPVSTIGTDKLSEARAIQRAREGDPSAFEYLYRLHSQRVYAVCRRMVGNPTEAEDLTQEAFLLLFRKIQTFRGESAFSTWLHRLAVNTVLMHLRKKSPPIVSIQATPDPEDETVSLDVDIGQSDLLLEGVVDRINLKRCIAQLPVGYRSIFVLHDIQGYQHNEIAEILGRSVGDSKSQLHKARTRLREQLQEHQRDKARDECLLAAKRRSRCSKGSFVWRPISPKDNEDARCKFPFGDRPFQTSARFVPRGA
jgi:RNA polymerase sigma-70 factor, ECF subfamily